MPIAVAPIGKPMKVVKILADERTKKHLNSLGVTVDAIVTVLSSQGGTVICQVLDGRLAMDRNVSTKILVA